MQGGSNRELSLIESGHDHSHEALSRKVELLALQVDYGGARRSQCLLGILDVVLAVSNVVTDGTEAADLSAQDAIERGSCLEQASLRGLTSLNRGTDFLSEITKLLVVGSQGETAVRHVVRGGDVTGSSGKHFVASY